jgi:hypothetical protein
VITNVMLRETVDGEFTTVEDVARPLKLIPKEFSVFPIEYPRVPSDGRPRAAAIARALEK